MRSYKDEGIVLQRRSYGEADRIISLFTRDSGKVSLLAKSVRRPSSRKRGHLEVFSCIRFSANRTKGIDILSEVETKENFSVIRKNLKKASLAYYLIEAVNKITREGESNHKLFNLLLEALVTIEKTKRLKRVKEKFVEQALVVSGFWPESKKLLDPDKTLESVVERRMGSARVGKRVLS